MAQSVKDPTLDFSSGHDLMVHELEPCVGLSTDSTEPDAGLKLMNHEIMT